MSISKKKLRSFMVLLLEIGPISFLYLNNTTNELSTAMMQVGIVALCCMVLTLISLRISSPGKNAFVYFMGLLYLFSFGQCIMAIIGKETKRTAFSLSRGFFSPKEVINGSIFVLVSILLTTVGFLLYSYQNKPKEKKDFMEKVPFEIKTEKARRIGWLLIAIGAFPMAYLLYLDFKTMTSFGYGMTLGNATGMNKILVIISGFFISGLLLVFCYEKKHRVLLYIIIIAYWGGELVGGSRISVFRTAIVFLLLEDIYFKKMDRKRWIIVIVFAIGGVIAMSFISGVRNNIYLSDDVGKLLKTTFENMWDNNFIFSAANEMGNTQLINTLVIEKCPSEVPFQIGLSFVKMIVGIFPNVFGFAFEGVDSTFSEYYTYTSSGMGASYISEGYWNFGYFSLLYFVIFGMLIGKMVSIFGKMSSSRDVDPAKFFVVVYLIYYVLFLVRSEALWGGRSFVFYALMPYIMINARFSRKFKQVHKKECS